MPESWDVPPTPPSSPNYGQVTFATAQHHPDQSQCAGWWRRCMMAILLLGQVILRIARRQVQQRQIVEHLVAAGPQSLLPLLLTNGFAGMIFTLQTARELEPLGAINTVGGAFAIAFCRELAPVLSAGILAGQVGSAFAAELGSMKITEQIDALYMLRTDPIDYLVVPRVIACSLMLPIMTVIALFVGIAGGCAIATQFYGQPTNIFLESVRSSLTLPDVLSILLKGWLFGILIAIIGCGWGLTTQGGVKGVGRSATSAVVTIWVSIFIVDFFLSWAIFHELAV